MVDPPRFAHHAAEEELVEADPNVLMAQIGDLKRRIEILRLRMPNSNIISPKFWTRAWAVVGHRLAIFGIFGIQMGPKSRFPSALGSSPVKNST
jgi:hypothetical protein